MNLDTDVTLTSHEIITRIDDKKCRSGKILFKTQQSAEMKAALYRQFSYKCRMCNAWHLTSKFYRGKL